MHGDPADPRTDDIRGDLGVGNQILTDWGLHLIDVNLGMGNLVDIVRQQSRAWRGLAIDQSGQQHHIRLPLGHGRVDVLTVARP